MDRGRVIGLLAVVGAVVVAGATLRMDGPASEAGPREFVELLGRDIDVDYTPLTSPARAVDVADLIIIGRVTRVSEGIRVLTPGADDDTWLQFTTLEVEASEILTGSRPLGSVVVQVARAPATSLREVVQRRPDAEAVLILEDMTHWQPESNAAVVYPDGIDARTRVYTPYVDGLWFRDGDQLVGTVESGELGSGWDGARSFRAMREALRGAAASS